jgi:hypothetical protein
MFTVYNNQNIMRFVYMKDDIEKINYISAIIIGLSL